MFKCYTCEIYSIAAQKRLKGLDYRYEVYKNEKKNVGWLAHKNSINVCLY